MHSSTVFSLLAVAAVAYAAPAGPSASSSSASSQASVTSSAHATVLSTSSAASSTFAAASSVSASSSAAKPSASSAGRTGTDTGSNKATFDANYPAVIPVNTRAANADLINKLLSVSTQGDRQRLLDQPGDYVFDFNNANAPEGSESVGKGGFTVAANAKTMPALIGLDSAQTLGFLGPCGFNTPHVHNRATELNTVVQGRLVTNFVGENGVKAVENTVSKFQMAVFPQGAIHAEFNPDCEDAVFVASFNNADPGVTQIAQGFFNLRGDGIAATLGGVSTINGADLESFRDLVPANVAYGVESCLKRCNINKNAKRDISEFTETA